MTYKTLYSVVFHCASKFIAHTLPLLLSGCFPRNRVPDHLRDFALAVPFAQNAFLHMNMGQSLTQFRFCSNATLSVRTSLATSYLPPLLYFPP